MNKKLMKEFAIWLLLGGVSGVLSIVISAMVIYIYEEIGFKIGYYDWYSSAGLLNLYFYEMFFSPFVGLVLGVFGGLMGGIIGRITVGVKIGRLGAIMGGIMITLTFRLLDILFRIYYHV